jgi:hypothetical protein
MLGQSHQLRSFEPLSQRVIRPAVGKWQPLRCSLARRIRDERSPDIPKLLREIYLARLFGLSAELD